MSFTYTLNEGGGDTPKEETAGLHRHFVPPLFNYTGLTSPFDPNKTVSKQS